MNPPVKAMCLSLALLSSCAGSDDTLREQLAAAGAGWQSHGIESYDVHQGWLCECLPPFEWLVHVRHGQVESVSLVDTMDLASPDADTLVALALERASTVEEAFALVEEWIGEAALVEVSYDESLGYPSTVFIDPDSRTVDEEIRRSMQDLRIVQPGGTDLHPSE